MINLKPVGIICKALFVILLGTITSIAAFADGGEIAKKVIALKEQNVFTKEYPLFTLAPVSPSTAITEVAKNATLLSLGTAVKEVLDNEPQYIRFTIPLNNGAKVLTVLLYKVSISPNGYTLITSDGMPHSPDRILNYRGCISNDGSSVASMTFSENETMGIISSGEGNYVIGKVKDNSGLYIVYNDQQLVPEFSFHCGTAPDLTKNNNGIQKHTIEIQSTKCVNFYWEADYDLYTDKGSSVSNVNTYLQGVFNQMATLYANDGISISLKTVYVWTTTDPYVGPSTDAYLDQFGVTRTSFSGDLAMLVGYKGGGGIAYVGTLCMSVAKYKMGYSGISSSYSVVPTYSWTVECLTHETGHLLGSNHTHDCAWNGNYSKIDDCGGSAGYSGGTCTPAPNPLLPVGGGTIMSYCHLTSVGIKFSLGFGPQPAALILNNVNNASCITSCACATPPPPASISGTTTTCPNTPINYTAAAVSGATSYSWSLPSGWTGTSTTNTIAAVAGNNGGNVAVVANNSCGSSGTQTLTVAIAVPDKPASISGTATVCPGESQIYTVAAVAGATGYIWTLPSGWAGSSSTTSISVTTGSTGGTITAKAYNSCGSGIAQSLTATVSTVAQPGAISGSAAVCPNATQTYSVSPVAGATSYTWTLPSGWTGSSTTNTIAATTGTAGGAITVKANNTCGSSTAQSLTATISSTLAQPGTITGNASVCSGSSQTYSVTAVAGATSYIWTLPSGWTGASTTSSITTTAGSAGGTITVAAKNSCGNSAAQSLVVAVASAAKPGTISGNATVCPAISETYSVSPVAGASSYTWTLPSGWTGTSTNNSITAKPGTTGGTITIKANSSCGSSAAQSMTVSVTAAPAQPGVISGTSTVCKNSTKTYSVSPVAGAVSYTWTLPSGWTGSSTTNSITATIGTSGGTISVKANNSCGTAGTARSLAVSITSGAPVQPGVITGKVSVCKNSSQIYSIAAVSGALSYTWTLPLGWSGSSTTKSITITPGDSSGVISVVANNDCGSSTARTLFVQSLSAVPAQPGIITGSNLLCKSSKQKYIIMPVANASSYSWKLPSGWSGTSVVDSITATAGSTGTITVSAVNACGISTSQTLAVTVNTVPLQPGVISGSAGVCAGSEVNYFIAPVPAAASYTWTMPTGWTGSSSSTSILAMASSSSGNVTVKANNMCGSSSARALAVTVSNGVPITPASISGNKIVSKGSLQTYAISSVAGARSYTWKLPNGWSGTSTTTSIKVTVGDSSGVISVTANNSCGSSAPQTLAVSITNPSLIIRPDDRENQLIGFVLYPNPSVDGKVTLSFKEGMTDATVEIYNMAGQAIYNQKFAAISENPTSEITLDATPGIYMVSVTGSGNRFVQRLVIQK